MPEVKKPEMPLLRETAEEIYQRMYNRASELAQARGETPPSPEEGEIFYDFHYPLALEISEQQQLDEYRFLQWYLPWADGEFLDAWGVFLGVKRKTAEPEELYRQRLIAKAGEEEGSGAEYDYKRWVKEVPNVGELFIWGEAPNTVHIALTDQNGQPADEALVKTVTEHLAQPDKHSLNDKVVVQAAKALEVTISGDLLEWESSVSVNEIKQQIQAGIVEYINKQSKKILYSEIYRLFKVAGVIDYRDVLLNHAQENIDFTFSTIPIVKNVMVNTL
ncbi:baseplate J/gp47 family protein [Brevibacillus laterosporus]|uniref:baseplate J/gp47 family protein n=1 Tax=Brevibacillus laterosporus TaxID=1465 RepID=UPI002E21CD55|nr:baseplate J/gp47 family protein [Brevibacillus laterosporus]